MSCLRTALLLALLPSLGLAATPIDERRPLSPGADVSIENVKGLIRVRSWDRDELHVSGSLGEGVEKLVIEGQGDRVQVRVEYPQGGGWFGWGSDRQGEPTTLEVSVPRRLGALDLEAVSADVDVAEVEVAELQASSVSGDLRVRATAGEARTETVSGDQQIEVATADLRAESVSGDVRLSGAVSGRVHAEAVSGDIEVSAATLESFSASTVSGDIEVGATLGKGARVRIEALSGDVTVRLPASTSARVSASSFSGTIKSDVGTVETAEHGPGSSLEARAGDGDADVELETFSGEIDLRLD